MELAVLPGSHIFLSAEYGGEILRVLEAAVRGNFFQAELGVEQVFCNIFLNERAC